ncbi:MAG: hypothetical protein ACOYMA_13465 [Bacteroidia bacterium]
MSFFKIFYIFFLTTFFFSSCEKETKDYRDKYAGTWLFKVKTNEYLMGSNGYNRNDSVEYIGKIQKGSAKNEIIIVYTKTNEITLTINDLGELSNFPTIYCVGNLENDDKISISLRWGGLGGSTSHVIDGFKF